MKNFSEFVKANKAEIYALAKENTRYNEDGVAVISRDDSWFYEDEWDEYFKKIDSTETIALATFIPT